MTTTTLARRQNILQIRFALHIPSSQDVKIRSSASLLSNDNILFFCDECHAPITLFSIPILKSAILCPDCFEKHIGALLNLATAKTTIFLGEIKK